MKGKAAGGYDFSVLRALRRQADVTLETVAAATGLSFSTLNRIERNQNLPSLTTLSALAEHFAVSPATLLEMAQPVVVEQVDEELEEIGDVKRRGVSFPDVRLVVGEAQAGDYSQKPHRHDGFYQIQWVIEGRVRCRVQGHDTEVGPGCAIRFDADFEHVSHFLEDTRYLVVLIPKRAR